MLPPSFRFFSHCSRSAFQLSLALLLRYRSCASYLDLEVDTPMFMPLPRGTTLLVRSFRLRLRDYHSLWCCFPADFGSEKGCSPPHLPPCCQDGIQHDLTGFHSLLPAGYQLVSFPPSTKMLHFEGLLRITALTQTLGSKTACVYPRHFAACRVGLRAQAKPSTKWRSKHMTFTFRDI